MTQGRADEPKVVGLVVDQLLRSARGFTDDIFSHIVPLSSDLHYSFDDINKKTSINLPNNAGVKNSATFRMLADNGRDAESKSKEVLFVISDHMKQNYYEVEILIKRYQSISTLPTDDFKKIKKLLTKVLVNRFFEWSISVQGKKEKFS